MIDSSGDRLVKDLGDRIRSSFKLVETALAQ